jgi:hypothetical protein
LCNSHKKARFKINKTTKEERKTAMKKRILSLLLLTVMLFSLIAMTACDDEPAPPANQTLAAAMKEAGYTTFVYPSTEDGDENLNAAYAIINNAFKALTGADLLLKEDGGSWTSNIQNNNKEILIGDTNRTASAALNKTVQDNRSNSQKDYQIQMGNQEIILATGKDTLGYVGVASAFAAMLSQPVSTYSLDNYNSGLIQYQWEWGTIGGAAANTYQIVYPAGADASVQKAVKALRDAIYLVSGYKLNYVADTASQKTNEILVGHTNRALSTTLAQNSGWRNNNAMDYMFLAQGTKIAIMAGDDASGTESAVAAFIASRLTAANAQALNWSDSYQLPGIHDLTIGGVPAGDFQIVVDNDADFDTHYNAIRLHNYLLNHTGYNIPIVTEDAPKIANEIILGYVSNRSASSNSSMAANAWKMVYRQGSLILTAKNYIGVTTALKKLVSDIGAANGALHIPTNYAAQGTADIPVTWTGTAGNTPASVAAELKLGVTDRGVTGTYTLAWNDEFDNFWGDSWFDLNKWHMHDSMGSGNWTDVRYTVDQEDGLVKVENGTLIMQTVKENSTSRPWATHQAVVTNDTMNFKYGYLEMRGAPPYKGEVEWPSYWSHSGASTLAKQKLGAVYTSAAYQIEIDFFEIFASADTAIPNLHKWQGAKHDQISGVDQGAANSGTRVYNFTEHNKNPNEMHTYGFLWTENLMAFSIDGEFYYSYNLNHDFGGQCAATMAPFKTQYLQVIFNSTIYTPVYLQNNGWLGERLQNNIRNIGNATFPYVYTVDYVRLYRVSGYGDLITTPVNTLTAQKNYSR